MWRREKRLHPPFSEGEWGRGQGVDGRREVAQSEGGWCARGIGITLSRPLF